METTNEIRKRIEVTQRQLEQDKAILASKERACQHHWGNVEYTPIIKAAYKVTGSRSRYGNGYIPYDEVPYLNDMYVPEERTDMWTRTCIKCGVKDTTTQKKANTTYNPVFNNV